MPKLSNNEPIILKLQEQLYWFVNKLIELSKNPITLQPYHEDICFPVDLLRKAENGLFPIGRYEGEVIFDSEDQEYAQYCKEMLEKIKRDIYKLENKDVRFNEEKFSWYEDPGQFGYGYVFFIDCDHKPLFEAYLCFLIGDKTGPNVILQKTKKKQLQLPNLPGDLKWEEITIRFFNGDEVQITAKDKAWQSNYELMGFKDQKTKNPNLQWKFLKALSLVNSFLNWDNNKNLNIKQRNNVKKRKQELSQTLKIYFHTIKDDPFFGYKEENGYKIKIQLIPEQGSDIKDTKKIISNNTDSYNKEVDPDTQDFFNEQMSDSDNW